MNIVHLINSLDPDTGGPPVVVSRLAAAQAKLGHTVAIVGGCPDGRQDRIDAFMRETPGIDSVNIRQCGIVAGALSTLASGPELSIFDEINATGKIDVVHLHGLWKPMLVRTARWCRRNSVPYVLCPHGMLDEWVMTQGALKKKFALASTHRSLVRNAASIHCLNDHERQIIGRYAFGPRLDIIPNGVFIDEVDIETEPREFRDAIKDLGDAPYALFLSRLHYKKGLDILADAWAIVAPEFPDARLVVAGPRDGDAIDEFNARIAKAKLQNTTLVVGPIYGTAKTSAYRDANVFVLPSRQEGFSMAITEALALGTPAVVTRECHYPDITEANAGVETDLTPESVADGLRRVFADDVFRDEAGARGATLVRERYTWPAIAERSLTLYDELRGSAGR